MLLKDLRSGGFNHLLSSQRQSFRANSLSACWSTSVTSGSNGFWMWVPLQWGSNGTNSQKYLHFRHWVVLVETILFIFIFLWSLCFYIYIKYNHLVNSMHDYIRLNSNNYTLQCYFQLLSSSEGLSLAQTSLRVSHLHIQDISQHMLREGQEAEHLAQGITRCLASAMCHAMLALFSYSAAIFCCYFIVKKNSHITNPVESLCRISLRIHTANVKVVCSSQDLFSWSLSKWSNC